MNNIEELNLVLAATECANPSEREWLEKAAIKSGWLEEVREGGLEAREAHVRLTPAGVSHIESLALDSARSEKAFVAMWFTGDMDEIFKKGISPAVEEAGYRAYKVDLDNSFDHQITDQIFYEIGRSRFLIADFTHDKKGARGGVYFEAGFAKGLGIPIIWCIRKDGVSKMHFDTDHYPHIVWTDADDLRSQLVKKIRAFIGPGPLSG